jgi:hypothetical protein
VLEPQTARYLLRIASGVPPSAPSKDLDYLAEAADLIQVFDTSTATRNMQPRALHATQPSRGPHPMHTQIVVCVCLCVVHR